MQNLRISNYKREWQAPSFLPFSTWCQVYYKVNIMITQLKQKIKTSITAHVLSLYFYVCEYVSNFFVQLIINQYAAFS